MESIRELEYYDECYNMTNLNNVSLGIITESPYKVPKDDLVFLKEANINQDANYRSLNRHLNTLETKVYPLKLLNILCFLLKV